MRTEMKDGAVASAVERAVAHPAPYSDDELATVRELRVTGAASLEDLAQLVGLERLEIIGSNVTELAPLSRLRSLELLRVLACPIESAESLVGLDRLRDLRIDFCFVEDASPLFALPALQRARLLGNPWSEASWNRLHRHGRVGNADGAARPIFELGAEVEVDLHATRQLRAFGMDLSFGSLDAMRSVLVRPGTPRMPGHEVDWTVADAADVWLHSKKDWTTDSLFSAVESFHTARGGNVAFDFESHREFGDRDEALAWIASQPDELRRALTGFIERYPGAVFVREDEAFLAMTEARANVTLPAWYRAARSALSGAYPEQSAEFQVDRFTGPSPRMTGIEGGDIWYRPRFETYDSDEGPTIRDALRLYPFAAWPEQGRSALSVKLDDPQPGILEFGLTDIFDERRNGMSGAGSVYRVYEDYAALLAHISAFRLADGSVVQGNRQPDDPRSEVEASHG